MSTLEKLLQLWLSTAGKDPHRRVDLMDLWLRDAAAQAAASAAKVVVDEVAEDVVKVSRSVRNKVKGEE